MGGVAVGRAADIAIVFVLMAACRTGGGQRGEPGVAIAWTQCERDHRSLARRDDSRPAGVLQLAGRWRDDRGIALAIDDRGALAWEKVDALGLGTNSAKPAIAAVCRLGHPSPPLG